MYIYIYIYVCIIIIIMIISVERDANNGLDNRIKQPRMIKLQTKRAIHPFCVRKREATHGK